MEKSCQPVLFQLVELLCIPGYTILAGRHKIAMKILFLVGIGGGLGTIARYLSQKAAGLYLPLSFPYGTFLVNIAGSLIIGLIFGLSEKTSISPEVRLFLATGFCGGFTTFSTFTLDALMMIRGGHYIYLSLYIVLSIVLGLAATFGGVALARLF